MVVVVVQLEVVVALAAAVVAAAGVEVLAQVAGVAAEATESENVVVVAG